MSGLDKQCVDKIIGYITYNPAKVNTEIMYQPIMELENEILIIAPMLVVGSSPERNLLAVVSSNMDYEYSKEVNDLEDLMIQRLEDTITITDNIKIAKHKNLEKWLPDVDFAILNKKSNELLICELKWFAAADSTKEVCAKEDEITHGCEQVESIMAYAMSDKSRFLTKLFSCKSGDDADTIDLFCCVIARHNIRNRNKHVPVIDLKSIIELFSGDSLNNVFHIIRNHEYETKLPKDAVITYKEIRYGGFVFKIPAICFGNYPL